MSHTIAFVFKALILTVLFGMAYTLTVCLIDVFVTLDRMQGVAEFMQQDVAQNNCLLNSTYTTMLAELKDIESHSSFVALGTKTDRSGTNLASANVSNIIPVEVYLKGKTPSTAYIQVADDGAGAVPSDLNLIPAGHNFYVANYGDILTMRINAVIQPEMWVIHPSEGITNTAGGAGYFWWMPKVPVSLTYNVPALLYLK